jgi:hypothetical protein
VPHACSSHLLSFLDDLRQIGQLAPDFLDLNQAEFELEVPQKLLVCPQDQPVILIFQATVKHRKKHLLQDFQLAVVAEFAALCGRRNRDFWEVVPPMTR